MLKLIIIMIYVKSGFPSAVDQSRQKLLTVHWYYVDVLVSNGSLSIRKLLCDGSLSQVGSDKKSYK